MIAYFNAQTLNQDSNVQKSGDLVPRPGTKNQFVCYAVIDDQAYWAPLTGTWKDKRVRIDPAWLNVQYGLLGAGKVYLQDGKNAYAGPKASFVAASQHEQLHGARPHVSATGLAVIEAAIKARGGPLPDGV